MSRHVEGRVELRVSDEIVPPEGLPDLMRLPEILRNLPGVQSRAAGRMTVWRWEPAWVDGGRLAARRFVVRQFAHGGLLGSLWGTAFLSRRPMLGELGLALHALERGVPTCRPVALRFQRAIGPVFRAHYVTEEILGAVNLLELCEREAPGDGVSPGLRQAISRAVAGAVAAMHGAGIRHGDLNLKNILVTPEADPPRAFVIDFKKARAQNCVGLREGLRNLLRLDRSVVKWPASRRAITLSDRLRTLRDYLRAVEGAECDWKMIARSLRTRHRMHALSRKGREGDNE
ncbi:MAG: lipopolysaccharide kinase InaA family protein [Candidatus Brocadiia bacterium]|jgi:tRNA A-37 threonylcarbamoyl transferase component Bud32|nr:lipopolysaccharide kinase InaA family protein [Candidatus Brocadiia bacterium]